MWDNCELLLPLSLPLSLPLALLLQSVKCFTHTQCSHSCFRCPPTLPLFSLHAAALSRASLSLLLPRSCVHWTCTLCALSVFHSSCAPLSVDDLLIFAHFLHFYGFLHYFYTSYFVVLVVSVVDAFVVVVLGAYVYGLWFFLSFSCFLVSKSCGVPVTALFCFIFLFSPPLFSFRVSAPFLTNCLHLPSRFRFYFSAIRKCERTVRPAELAIFKPN